MAEILVVGISPEDTDTLADHARELSVRVKSVLDIESAHEWINLRSFDALCVQGTLDTHAVHEIIRKAWSRNPLTEVILFCAEKEWSPPEELILLGVPIAKGEERHASLLRVLQRIGMRPHRAPSPGNVVVVEDLDAPRDIICAYIEQLGIAHARGVHSAQEALTLLGTDPHGFTCVVTDIRMPEVSGEELIKRIRADRTLAHLPVVVLTAYGTVDALIACLRAGASGFLVKPPKRDDLRYELERAQRILAGEATPRLVRPEEADRLRDYLIEQGFIS